jgi:hypothetical protein
MGILGSGNGLAQERAEAHQPGDGHERDVRGNGRGRDQPRRRRVQRRLVGEFLGDEPEQRRQSCHRQRGKPGGHGGEGHRLAEPAEAIHVTRAGLVVQRAGDEEEGALVQGVGQQVRHRRVGRERPPNPSKSVSVPERHPGLPPPDRVVPSGDRGVGAVANPAEDAPEPLHVPVEQQRGGVVRLEHRIGVGSDREPGGSEDEVPERFDRFTRAAEPEQADAPGVADPRGVRSREQRQGIPRPAFRQKFVHADQEIGLVGGPGRVPGRGAGVHQCRVSHDVSSSARRRVGT